MLFCPTSHPTSNCVVLSSCFARAPCMPLPQAPNYLVSACGDAAACARACTSQPCHRYRDEACRRAHTLYKLYLACLKAYTRSQALGVLETGGRRGVSGGVVRPQAAQHAFPCAPTCTLPTEAWSICAVIACVRVHVRLARSTFAARTRRRPAELIIMTHGSA
jgi:hypothetical protein